MRPPPGVAPAPLDRALDEACGLVHAHDDARLGPLTTLYVSPEVYAAIAAARRRELARGQPLLVLDLDLALDPSLEGGTVRVS